MSEATSYFSEPDTNAKVVLTTTFGDLDIELWGKQCPLAVRNFIQLCLEGYYNGCEFFRIIPDFMAQTGDPSNTGEGGRSVFKAKDLRSKASIMMERVGLEDSADKAEADAADSDENQEAGQPFPCEFHSRLRFNRRGLIGMANNPDVKVSNQSQFFFTMAATPWLDRQSTLFGKVTGETLFNLLKLASAETDPKTHRPMAPAPRILSAEVLVNPFPHLTVPRIEEIKKNRARVEGKHETEQERTARLRKDRLRKRNLTLLSFGDDDDLAAVPASAGKRQKRAEGGGDGLSAHDLIADDPLLAKESLEELENESTAKTLDSVRAKLSVSAQSPPSQASSPSSSSSSSSKPDSHSDSEARSKPSFKADANNNDDKADPEELSESQFDDMMRRRVLERLDKGKGQPSASNGSAGSTASSVVAAEPVVPETAEEEKNRLKEEVKRLKQEVLGVGKKGQKAFQGTSAAAPADDKLLSALEQRREKYKRRRDNTQDREADTLKKLGSFQNSLKSLFSSTASSSSGSGSSSGSSVNNNNDDEAKDAAAEEDDDDDPSWLTHQLKFARRPQDHREFNPDLADYEIYDPLNNQGGKDPLLERRAAEAKRRDQQRLGGHHHQQYSQQPGSGSHRSRHHHDNKSGSSSRGGGDRDRYERRREDRRSRSRSRNRSRDRSRSRDRRDDRRSSHRDRR